MQIRRKSFLALGGLAASATMLAACSGDSDTTSGSGGGGSDAGGASDAGGEGGVPAAPAGAQLVIWADEEKAPALEPSAKAWGEQNGITVAVQVVPGDELQANFITANQAGNGPDITMGAHDWIGNLVQNSAISPVQLPSDVADTIAPIGIEAVTYDGQTYGVPYAVETLALFANNPPRSPSRSSSRRPRPAGRRTSSRSPSASPAIRTTCSRSTPRPAATCSARMPRAASIPLISASARRARWPRPTRSPSWASRAR